MHYDSEKNTIKHFQQNMDKKKSFFMAYT